jgi:rhodanese-related sulfurtransferase
LKISNNSKEKEKIMTHSIPRITMADLHSKLKQLQAKELVLDVRGPEEFAEGHVPGSRNIPHDQVAQYAEELKKFERVYIHCRSGKRAQMAVDALQKVGVNNLVCIADGGMLDWAAAGYEIVKGA